MENKYIDIDKCNPEFQLAFDLVKYTNQTFFLTGKAGTGKSTFMKYIVANVDKNFVVVAPTGIAAINAEGVTIHSFFQLPSRLFLPDDPDIRFFAKENEKRKTIEAMDTLIIDECSMLRIDLLCAIDCSLRHNGGNARLPFGGKQVVFVGDLYQLPPILPNSPDEKTVFQRFHHSPYFFDADIFNQSELYTVELKKVYRQKDPDFIKLLDRIRIGEISQPEIDILNRRCTNGASLEQQEFTLTLTTTKAIASGVNEGRLLNLSTKELHFRAEVQGDFGSSLYPTDFVLKLKVGAQVMFLMNDKDKQWVNGTIGKIVGLKKNQILVEIENGTICDVGKVKWENPKYIFNEETRKIEREVVGTFRQYPLKLAWAITIHKSQGLTFEKVIVDFGTGTFADGQAYVALSRVTSLNGLKLKRNIKRSDISVNKEVRKFFKYYDSNLEIVNSIIKNAKALHEPREKNHVQCKMIFENDKPLLKDRETFSGEKDNSAIF